MIHQQMQGGVANLCILYVYANLGLAYYGKYVGNDGMQMKIESYEDGLNLLPVNLRWSCQYKVKQPCLPWLYKDAGAFDEGGDVAEGHLDGPFESPYKQAGRHLHTVEWGEEQRN